MKTYKRINIFVGVIIAIFTLSYTNPAQAQNNNISFQQFYEELSPYGQWVNDRDLGMVWIPNAERDFQPYRSNGYWEQTNYGNTWVSDYEWGWAPFHYGRWNYSNNYGWAWIPGYEWAPAWVSWRSGGGYYGWAPLGPHMSINVSIGIADLLWTFLPSRHITDRYMHRYYVGNDRRRYAMNNTRIMQNSHMTNNHRYASGPSISDMERSTGRRISVREVSNSSRPGMNRTAERSDRTTNRSDRTPNQHDRTTNRDNRSNSSQQVMHIGRDGSVNRSQVNSAENKVEQRNNSRSSNSSREQASNNYGFINNKTENDKPNNNRTQANNRTPANRSTNSGSIDNNRAADVSRGNSHVMTSSRTTNQATDRSQPRAQTAERSVSRSMERSSSTSTTRSAGRSSESAPSRGNSSNQHSRGSR